jgi:hypothetical protein
LNVFQPKRVCAPFGLLQEENGHEWLRAESNIPAAGAVARFGPCTYERT